MRRFWDSGPDQGDIEARLRAERPGPSHDLVDRITGQLADDGKQRRELSKTRRSVAVVFASLVLMSGFGAAAFGAAGGNGNGNNGNGNGNSGTPAGCVEGQGQVTLQNPNC
jgi:hypothetical protein